MELNSNYGNNDTYAAHLFELGEFQAAMEQAEVVIVLAEEEGAGQQGTTELLQSL